MIGRIKFLRHAKTILPSQDYHLTVAQDVLIAVQGEVSVLLDYERGVYYSLNEVGTTVWTLIQNGTTLHSLFREIASAYDIDACVANSDISDLINQLLGMKLIKAESCN